MQWNTIPRKLQRELFDTAGSLGDVLQTAALRGQIARFLHDHKNDECARPALPEGSDAKGQPVDHKFAIGQIVDLEPNVLRAAALGPYEIRHLVPAPDSEPDVPRYRIKCDAENHERIAPESELTLSATAFSPDFYCRRPYYAWARTDR